MDFPIVDLFDDEVSEVWLLKHFHPQGLKCPGCGAARRQARVFRQTCTSRVTVYRCKQCDQVYNVYSGTVFAHKQLRSAQAVLLLRGVCKGESTASLARELKLAYGTVHDLRKRLQANAACLQPTTPVPDQATETDEMFQNAGEKRYAPR